MLLAAWAVLVAPAVPVVVALCPLVLVVWVEMAEPVVPVVTPVRYLSAMAWLVVLAGLVVKLALVAQRVTAVAVVA